MVNVSDIRKPNFEVSPQFINRWSPRSFLEREIPEDVLFSLFEAARWAPSASNIQPWRFIIARTKEDLEKFHSFILPGNLVWCQKAPVLAVIASQKTTERGFNSWHAFDSGTAWGHLSLEANAKGLITHAMGGFDKEKAREVLNVPEDIDLHAVIAIGYQGEKDALPENLQEREQPSGRRPLEELLFEGVFKNTENA
ncbi:nitroreductase family protein [Bacillus sp. UMB0899]|uniref:nitroreductase family protein n=1 Tax=Metabacillus schmidteae TaxID=2730405 RepID=UPI000C801C33|nr:nitroreductase family protein [Metabacillus schmidteae]PMC33931.1 nitroreductase family protein [Bacillus sp. UMB0899]